MPMVARQTPFTLFIVDDNDPINPREDYEPFGKMLCWHSRYSLGDKHGYSEPLEFLRDKLDTKYRSDTDPGNGNFIYDYIKNGHAKDVRLEYNRATREWNLYEKDYWASGKNWLVTTSYPANMKGKDIPEEFFEDCLSALRFDDLVKLVEQIEGMAILPLYLFDHSGLSMNTVGYSCPWDSGQVGWIYADSEMMKNEYGNTTDETIEKAKQLLESEVVSYNCYLSHQCYGFKLYKNDEEVDSCWGFLGELSDVTKYVRDYLPTECKDIVDSLDYEDDIDIDDYLEQVLEDEDEMEM